MKVAFDLDGTITAYPRQCRELAESLVGNGHSVVVLTACADPGRTQVEADEIKRAALQAVRFDSFTPLQCFLVRDSNQAALLKAEWCQRNGVNVLIDDARLYCETVKRACPSVLVLHVCEVPHAG